MNVPDGVNKDKMKDDTDKEKISGSNGNLHKNDLEIEIDCINENGIDGGLHKLDENQKENEIENLKTTQNINEKEKSQTNIPPISLVTFSNTQHYQNIFKSFNIPPVIPKKNNLCAISNEPAKYFDPLTKLYYSNVENFKILRERYFQKEEDNLLFRIQTLSDFASQKKEKLKKHLLSNNSISESTFNQTSLNNTNMLEIVNKYGLLKNEGVESEKKSSARIINLIYINHYL